MSTELQISPEALTICETYLACGSDAQRTADQMCLPKEVVVKELRKRESKKYIDEMWLESGYMNRDKILDTMSGLIEKKLEQMLEDETTSDADILDLMKALMKFRQDEVSNTLKRNEAQKVNQTNIQVNNGYSEIMEKVLNGK
jgi:glutamyl-tRNA reductase